jgi:D-lactate dehydrogenase
MKVAVFSSKTYDKEFLMSANQGKHSFEFFETHLSHSTLNLTNGFDAVCAFVNDDLKREVLEGLAAN